MSTTEIVSVEWSCFSIDNETISELSEEWKGEAENSVRDFLYGFAKNYAISSFWDMLTSSAAGLIGWWNKPQ